MANHSRHILACFQTPTSISPFDRTDVDIEVREVVHISMAPGFPFVEPYIFHHRGSTLQHSLVAVICLRFPLKSLLTTSVMAVRQVIQVAFGVNIPRIRRFLLPSISSRDLRRAELSWKVGNVQHQHLGTASLTCEL